MQPPYYYKSYENDQFQWTDTEEINPSQLEDLNDTQR